MNQINTSYKNKCKKLITNTNNNNKNNNKLNGIPLEEVNDHNADKQKNEQIEDVIHLWIQKLTDKFCRFGQLGQVASSELKTVNICDTCKNQLTPISTNVHTTQVSWVGHYRMPMNRKTLFNYETKTQKKN